MTPPTWNASFANWLNLRRIRAQAVVLALCLWGVCAVDFSTAGLFDRAGNIKFQDFLPFYISARLIAQHRSADLYNAKARTDELKSIVGQPTPVRLPNMYGPQVSLLFVPLASLPFLKAASLWTVFSLILQFGCIYAVWRCLPNLRACRTLVLITALAFPPLFHFFVRGQISALVLLCFTAGFLALQNGRPWLAGFALGCLVLKPQFLAAVPLILLLSGSWSMFAGLVLAGAAQLAFARFYFGPFVMHSYFDLLLHPSAWIDVVELSLAPIQMHSLRSFWSLLIPNHAIALGFYVVSSALAMALAVAVWKSQSTLAVRFSALVLAAVLINPHLFVYDLMVLAPQLLLLTDWSFSADPPIRRALQLLLYLAFVLPLLGPLSRWTHLQVSVLAFSALLYLLWRISRNAGLSAGRELATSESAVV